ncbi:MAG: DNA primase [Planctomycetota bacterium]
MRTGRISEQTLVRIRDATEIVSLVESYVSLKRSGKNWKGLCPFHDEKTPSFTVSPDHGSYNCFGCGKKGSAFDFVIAMDRVEFREAAEILADRSGIEIEFDEVKGGTTRAPSGPQKTDLHRANKWAASFFRRELLGERGADCRAYLESRGIRPEQWEKFGIGYAPEGWSFLVDAAVQRNIPEDLLADAGLAKRREKGPGLYDAFRDRLMFSIRDSLDRVIAFGGRCLDGSEPKYLNSPETKVFSKRKSLYGIESLRSHKFGEPVFVMEGYTDVVMAGQVGAKGCVATLGTSLTEEHARVLTRYTNRVVLVYDGDAAGRKAAERGAELFCSVDASIQISRLPAGQDPCDFLLERGKEGFATIEDGAEDFFEFVLAEVRERSDLSNVSGVAQAADELLKMAHAVANPVKRGLVLDRIARELGLRRGDLLDRARTKAPRSRPSPAPGLEPESGPSEPMQTVAPAQRRAERQLLRALLRGGAEGTNWAQRLQPGDVILEPHRALLERILKAKGSGGEIDIPALSLGVEDLQGRELLNEFLLSSERDLEALRDQLLGALDFFERERDRKEIAAIKSRGLGDDNLEAIVKRLRASRRGKEDAESP